MPTIYIFLFIVPAEIQPEINESSLALSDDLPRPMIDLMKIAIKVGCENFMKETGKHNCLRVSSKNSD